MWHVQLQLPAADVHVHNVPEQEHSHWPDEQLASSAIAAGGVAANDKNM